jgi:hypothetical protein
MAFEARNLLVVLTDVAAEVEGAFNAWYDNVHLPEIVALPGVRLGRRFRVVEDHPAFPAAAVPKYLALYELEDADAVAGAAFASRRGWGEFRPSVSNNRAAVYEFLHGTN